MLVRTVVKFSPISAWLKMSHSSSGVTWGRELRRTVPWIFCGLYWIDTPVSCEVRSARLLSSDDGGNEMVGGAAMTGGASPSAARSAAGGISAMASRVAATVE